MNRSWLFLAGAVACEALWAIMLKVSRGFTVPWATAVTLVAYLASLGLLGIACTRLDISLAYAIWTGSGAALVALFGAFALDEPLGVGRAVGLCFVVIGVVVLVGQESRV